MRSDDFASGRRSADGTRVAGVNSSPQSAQDSMTGNSAKYWSSGAIPLLTPDILAELIANSSDLAIVLSDVGKIHSVLVNPAHHSAGQLSHWEGRDIREFLTYESVPKLETRLEDLSGGQVNSRSIELNHTDGTDWEFPVLYTFHQIGPDGALLMLGRDLRPVAEMQLQLVKAQMALESDYEAKREFDARYRVLLEASRDAMVFVNLSTGRISDLNAMAATLMGANRDALMDSPFAPEFEGRRRGELLETLTSAAIAEDDPAMELTTRRTRKPVEIIPTIYRAAGGRQLLCRIETREAEIGIPDAETENLIGLFEKGADAILFTDREGHILSANEAFLNLVSVANFSSVKGASLADYLSRGAVDLKVLIDNAARNGQMRLYATKMSGEFAGDLSVEVSATYLNDRAKPCVAFVIRDTSRVDTVRRGGVTPSPETMRPAMDLVGSATLKEIVSETTDVIEKMCIETAVELTHNNRVAAAEMLGLSRQSLYVKLRKYDLLER